MRLEGDIKCLDKLLQPALRVNNNDLQTLRIKGPERRVQLWSEIKENLERYEDGECGKFYEDIHKDTIAKFYIALLKLAATFSMNQERFDQPEKLFSPAEIELVQKLEKYNGFDIKSSEDVVSEIRGGDRTTIDYIADYMNEMKDSWVRVLNDSEIKLPVRAAIKETMGKRVEVLEAGVMELMKQPGGIGGFIRETKVAQQPQVAINTGGGDIVLTGGIHIVGPEQPRVRRYPRCNWEAKRNEKYCPECGTIIGGV